MTAASSTGCRSRPAAPTQKICFSATGRGGITIGNAKMTQVGRKVGVRAKEDEERAVGKQKREGRKQGRSEPAAAVSSTLPGVGQSAAHACLQLIGLALMMP